MTKRHISRRAVLKGSAAAAATVFAAPARAQLPPAAPLNDALIAAAKKEGKVSFYTAMDLDFAQRLGKAFEAKYGICDQGGALRRRTRVPAHRPGAYVEDLCRRHRQHRRCRACASSGSATAGSRPICRRRSRSTTTRPTTTPMGFAIVTRILVSPIAYNTELGEEGRRAEELQGPARPEMGGQDGQGPSRPIAAPS